MADSRFEKHFRLLSAKDFSELKIQSLIYKRPALIVYFKKNQFNQTRIGISVPKKIGKAHIRNRLKRLIREFFRNSPHKYLGFDILFVVSWSRSIADKNFEIKESNLLQNLQQFFDTLPKEG